MKTRLGRVASFVLPCLGTLGLAAGMMAAEVSGPGEELQTEHKLREAQERMARAQQLMQQMQERLSARVNWIDPEAEKEVRERTIVLSGAGGSFLGLGVQEVDNARAKTLNMKEEYGVEITRVEENSPAAKAGLQKGDVVLDYNGQRVEGTEQFIRLVRETPVGRTVKMQVFRNGSTQSISATTVARRPMMGHGPGTYTFTMPEIRIPEFRIPDTPHAYMGWRSGTIGVEAEAINAQLADFFGVKEGVLVRSVIKGSAAEKAGIKAGDVIVKVENEKVTTPKDVSAAIRDKKSKSFPLTVVREKKETTVNVTIEEIQAPKAPVRPTRTRNVKDTGAKM